MEPRAGAAEEVGSGSSSGTEFRWRLVAGCAFLVGLAMVQSPGLLVADTKFDLSVDPAGFLGRAVYLWDPIGAFGQMQNQAFGYLWPMGPFFLLGWLVDLPGWVVQRLWMALVLCVAMVGAARLVRALGARSDLACLVAGFAYALSPRMLTTVGPISSEAWPSALAPWVLLPLVLGAERGSARRAAALSGLAVAMVGGVNAAATLAVLPLGALWILTRTPGARKRTMLLWWPLFTALGTFWWLVPLFLMGAYSPPFLDFIESASTTTFPTTVFDALRGSSDWVAYLDPSWRAGNELLRAFYLPLNSGVILLLGLAGMVQRSTPHRLFLSCGVLLGLVLVTLGHTGAVQGWFAADLQALLDGALAPLRNVHKFDPVVRLPLVLGLGLLVDGWMRRLATSPQTNGLTSERISRVTTFVLVGTAMGAVLGAALPAVAGRLAPTGGLDRVPDYWKETAAWLADRNDGGTALLVPGSSFGSYLWGFPRDEPMQWLAESPWGVRNAVPLAPPGNIRMLDAVEQRLAEGRPSDGLATYLHRAGVSHVVVRNDLARSQDVPDPVLVHQSLQNSPGLHRVATFGPEVGGEAHLRRDDSRVLVNGGWQSEYPAIEVFRVAGTEGSAVTAEDPPVVVGGPEDLLDLADLDIVGEEPTVLAADGHEPPSASTSTSWILTDGLRAAERHFGRVHDGASATLTPEDPLRLSGAARDYLLDDGDRWSTTAQLEGVASLRASSSMSDANASGVVQRGQLPFAAVDGHVGTAWVANRTTTGEQAWWRLGFSSARTVDRVTIRVGAGQPQRLRVRTENVTTEPLQVPAGRSRTFVLEDPSTEWLRVEDASSRSGNQLSLAEVEVPQLRVERTLVLPETPTDWSNPATILLRSAQDARTGCVTVDEDVRCREGTAVIGEEPFGFERQFTLADDEEYDARLRVRARPESAAVDMLSEGLLVGVSASSRGVMDLRGSELAAVDGDLGTAWTAAINDLRPTLTLRWLGERRVSGLTLAVDPNTAARRPTELAVSWPGGRRMVEVDRDGEARFPPVRTDQLRLEVREAEPAASLGFRGESSSVPVGIGEVRLRGLPLFPITLSDDEVRQSCGSGPTVTVNGRAVRTAVSASMQELYRGAVVDAQLCGRSSLTLRAGANEVRVEASETFTPDTLVLGGESVIGAAVHHSELRQQGPVEASVIPSGEASSVVVVRRNANDGWQARQSGTSLEPVVVDGWKQGWRLVDSDTPVHLEFAPDRSYGLGLVAGGAGFLLLLAMAGVPDRRWVHREAPALVERTLPPALLLLVAVLSGGLLAGWLGAGLSGAAIVVVTWASASALSDAGRWVTAGLVLPAATAYAVLPWGGAGGWGGSLSWPHYLALLAVVGSLGWLAADSSPRYTFFNRVLGSSTNR